jgi:hypothetical protein
MKKVAFLIVLILSLVAVHAATPVPAAAAEMTVVQCCWCPWYTISCQTNSQCDSYCGTPGWGVCEGFCCACLG